jgi:hypothetical protein
MRRVVPCSCAAARALETRKVCLVVNHRRGGHQFLLERRRETSEQDDWGVLPEASVERVSAPSHSPKSAPLSDSMLIPQFAGRHPCLTYRWKLEYGQWLTCATYPCFTGFQWM